MRKFIAALRVLLLAGLHSAGLLAADASTQVPSFESFKTALPYRARWGEYFVSVEATGDDPRVANRLRISDHAGRVLKEINAGYIDAVDYPILNGRGGGEQLRVTTAPDNNLLANRRTYCFTRQDRLRNTLIMPCGIDQFRDLNGDGRPELLSDNPAPLEYVDGGGLCHAAYPPIYLVLQWNGEHYILANRRFPRVVRAQLNQKRKLFLEHVQEFQDQQTEGPSWDYLVGDAVGIYADMASTGQRKQACRWLLARLPSAFVRKQFLEILPTVKQRLMATPSLVTTDQHRIIHAPN